MIPQNKSQNSDLLRLRDGNAGNLGRVESIGMSLDAAVFLSLKRLPAVLYDFEVAWLLNCHPDDLPCLIAKGLLLPLGSVGAADETKRFSREMVLRVAANEAMLNEITNAIYRRRRPDNLEAQFHQQAIASPVKRGQAREQTTETSNQKE